MTWNLNTLYAFYQNQSNPAEYNRLKTEDPTGRIMATYLAAEQTYKDVLAEHKALGVGETSIDPTRSSELEGIMTMALATRTGMLAGLESCILAVGDQPEPTVRYLENKIVGMRRGRGSAQDITAIQGIIDSLEAIASEAFA
jgi:hypothetical protein